MYFKQFLHDETGCASYLIASRHSREAAVIDPQLEIQRYLALAAERGYRIVDVIDTHLHADHISGNRALARATGARMFLHAQAEVAFDFEPLEDGDEIQPGQLRLQVVHTPGHRPESISLLVTNKARSPAASMVLSGDTLMVGDVGRPDFGGAEGAVIQYASVQRLLELPDNVELFPAHFEGSCGKGLCGRPSSTIGFERRYNPVLQMSCDDFLRTIGEVSPRPLNMTAILATNQGRADYSGMNGSSNGHVSTVCPDHAPTWIRLHDAVVLDLREPEEYIAGHIPDAILLPQADLAVRVDEIPQDRHILVACCSGMRSLASARFLKAASRPKVSNLDGGLLAGWPRGTRWSPVPDRVQARSPRRQPHSVAHLGRWNKHRAPDSHSNQSAAPVDQLYRT